jgi:hypothetical protein
MSSFGRLIMARPMASICCSPPENVPAGCFERSPRMGKRSYCVVQVRADLSLVLAGEGAEDEILLDGESRKDAATLRGVGDAERDDVVRGSAVDRFALKGDAAAAGPQKPEMVRSVVVLPAPLVPISVTTWPSSTEKLIPLTASILP